MSSEITSMQTQIACSLSAVECDVGVNQQIGVRKYLKLATYRTVDGWQWY